MTRILVHKERATETLRHLVPTIETRLYSVWRKNAPVSGLHAYTILVSCNGEIINLTRYISTACGFRLTKDCMAIYAYDAQTVADRVQQLLFPNPPTGEFGRKYLPIHTL